METYKNGFDVWADKHKKTLDNIEKIGIYSVGSILALVVAIGLAQAAFTVYAMAPYFWIILGCTILYIGFIVGLIAISHKVFPRKK